MIGGMALGVDSLLKKTLGRSPGKGYPDPASLEMQTLYCNFLHFENTFAFPHPTPQLVNLKYLQKTHNNLLIPKEVCQINALVMKVAMQSKACVFQFYPINRLSLGQGISTI